MMNRLLDPKNPKDKFIIETLLPYLVDHIEESEFKRETADQTSSMYVFPYRTSEGTKLGSLKEPGISWYFDKNKEKKTVSSGGYRIIDDSVLSEKNAANFRKTFNEYCGISEFSDHAVIKDLLEKMSMETDYTSRWWTYAYDVFTLWRKEDFNSSLEMATKGMQNDRFLFIEGEYSDSLKQRLLKYGVFSDIRETSFKTCFWNLIKNRGDEKKAIEVLKRMGVPHTFIDAGRVNEHLLTFFERTSENAEYPVEFGEKEFEQCELSHDIMLHIYRENQEAFFEIATDSDVNAGIVLKNILGAYVPLSWDLFYSSKDELVNDKGFRDEFEVDIKKSRISPRESLLFTYSFLKKENGCSLKIVSETSGIIHVSKDICERIRSYVKRMNLGKRGEELQALVDNGGDLLIDFDGDAAYTNKEAVFFKPAGAWIHFAIDYLRALNAEDYENLFYATLKEKDVEELEKGRFWLFSYEMEFDGFFDTKSYEYIVCREDTTKLIVLDETQKKQLLQSVRVSKRPDRIVMDFFDEARMKVEDLAEERKEEIAQNAISGNAIKIGSRIEALRNLSNYRVRNLEDELIGAVGKDEERIRRAINRERAKTDEKIRILEEKLNYVGTYALDAICLLDVV